ncbi:MAG: hypothetical protein JW913_11950 [Chitinispirillaceae bacterium]|nr:hypothetical protein [Chitinispirillaceae bacterium]
MQRIVSLLVFVCCWWGSGYANPLPTDPYTQIAITEVYRTSLIDWSIELDGDWCLFDSASDAYPCSAKVYLRNSPGAVSSANRSYGVKVAFDKDRIGVITQSSAVGFIANQRVMLHDTNVVTILRDSLGGEPKCWTFPLCPVKPGNSLVMVSGSGGDVVMETKRKSIGSRCALLTRYYLKMIDSYGKALENIKPYSSSGVNYIGPDLRWNSAKASDSTGTIKLSMRITDPDKTISFHDLMSGQTERITTVLPTWNAKYIDDDSLVIDTVIIPVTRYKLYVVNNEKKPVSDIQAYRYDGSALYSNVQYNQWLAESGIWDLRVYQPESTATFCFNKTGCYPNKYGCMDSWNCTYIDTSRTIPDTLFITPTPVVAPYPAQVNSGIHFSALSNSARGIHFIVASPSDFSRASVVLMTVSGRKIGETHFRMDGPGTHAAIWKPGADGGGKLSAGTYLCRLAVDGRAAASCGVTVP